jgi:WD40 repeat protein
MLALSDIQGNAVVLDLNSGQTRPIGGKCTPGGFQVFAFSPDGWTLASRFNHESDRRWTSEVKLWDVETGNAWQGLPDDFTYTCELLFSRDGQTLVTVEAAWAKPGAHLRAWKLDHRLKRATLDSSVAWAQLKDQSPSPRDPSRAGRGPMAFSEHLAYAPGGAMLVLFLADGAFRLCAEGPGACSALCRVRGSEVLVVPHTDVAVPVTKNELDQTCRYARDVASGLKPRLLCGDGAVRSVRFSHDGRTAAVLLPNREHVTRGILRLIDVDSGRVVSTFPGSNVSLAARFEFAPDGGSLVITEFDSKARRWNFDRQPATQMLRGHTGEVWGLDFAPDGRTLASSSDDHTIKLWDIPSGRERATLAGHGSLVTMVKYAPDGRTLASSGFDKTVRLWDSATGKPIAVLEGHTDRVRTIAFSPDGRTLASGGSDRTVRFWDIATRQAIGGPLNGHTDWVLSLVFSPDGKTLYSGGVDETIRLWDRDTGRPRAVWRTKAQSLSFGLSPDGQTLASTEPGGNVTLWDTTRERAGLTLRGHALEVLGVTYSPDGRTLATGSRDRSVRLWDPDTGQELIELKGHEDQVRPVVFSPDGTTLASGGYDATIRLWRAEAAVRARNE